ncbi:MAG: DUF58 domain-containing protein, partial [Gemmatimonadetes bacterium]
MTVVDPAPPGGEAPHPAASAPTPRAGRFGARRLIERGRAAWRRLRAWRRIRFTLGGLLFSVGGLAVGMAAATTGNNLLYLLLGAMLGLIVVSSWLSEHDLGGLTIRRQVPTAVTVGRPAPLVYHVTNRKPRLPTLALELIEPQGGCAAFVARVDPGRTLQARAHVTFARRGVHRFSALTLSTAYPFGLFVKQRDLAMPGEIVVRPRCDRPVRMPSTAAGLPRRRVGESAALAAGPRGDYRGLREYRAGDDRRDIHWKATARVGETVVREYDQDAADALW